MRRGPGRRSGCHAAAARSPWSLNRSRAAPLCHSPLTRPLPSNLASTGLSPPRIARPDPTTSRPRPVSKVVVAYHTLESAGVAIPRPCPGGLSMAEADPFLLLDHAGPTLNGPGEAKGAQWHPHRGFETVTYMLDGRARPPDTTGGGRRSRNRRRRGPAARRRAARRVRPRRPRRCHWRRAQPAARRAAARRVRVMLSDIFTLLVGGMTTGPPTTE
jgi:hypothetical protein